VQVLKRENSGKGATLGDLLKDKLGAIKTTPASVPPPAPTDDES
jgi:hypothetical protein